MLTETWPLGISIAAFAGCALTLIMASTRFTAIVDRLADRTGIGEAVAGALLLGAVTSLPGLITTIVAAARSEPELAVSNALGGIAAQTLILPLADLLYRRANLEHAAASLPNILQTMVLIALIALVLLAASGPQLTVFAVHPISLLLPVAYLYGLHLARKTHEAPMWRPKRTAETRLDLPDTRTALEPLARLWRSFLALAAVVTLTGFVVAHAGLSIMAETNLSGTLVGGFMTGIITSLPELVTVIAAIRARALTLAVGDIIGGNTFDVLFVAAGDVAFRGGSIYHAIDDSAIFILALTILLTSVLAAGLIYRERKGIGFEGLGILGIYLVGFLVILFGN